MCGIAGLINWGNKSNLLTMLDLQYHRGPDDGGIWYSVNRKNQNVGLGSRRLAILDLSENGHMPMSTEDGKYTIVYNGEIYNFKELRDQLKQRGHKFKSNCDTEVILHLYSEYGKDSVKLLNGMFAFAIWDSVNDCLFLARDHFGIKPLYFMNKGDRFAFASELKALHSLPDFNKEISFEALNEYLTFLWVIEPKTIFKDVYKLEPGNYAIVKDGEIHKKQYWNISFSDNHLNLTEKDEELLSNELREMFFSTVKKQMISDVPVGLFLSAGIDSTAILAGMASGTSDKINTFTITFPQKHIKGNARLDDTSVASRTAEYFGTNHHEILVEPNVADLLPELVYQMDEPVADHAIIMSYLLNKKAKDDATVILSGTGGDEVFGGYRRYVAHFKAEQYKKLPKLLRGNLIEPFINSLPLMRGTKLKGYVELMKKFGQTAGLDPIDRFLGIKSYMNTSFKNRILNQDISIKISSSDAWSTHNAFFSEDINTSNFLEKMLYADIKGFLPSLNLNYNDKMSMASSVEIRVPFLDKDFYEWVSKNVPSSLKIKNGEKKHIFRKAMKGYVPDEVLAQKKAALGVPIDYWIANDLYNFCNDIIHSVNFKNNGLFKVDEVEALLKEHRKGESDWSMQIWQIVTLELWFKKYIN